jgi:RHS repeat-associated protein
MYNGHADVTALINATTGAMDATYYYDAFGNIMESTGNVDNNITYAGYQYDEETGLYYLNARMYDPKIARFLQEDTYRGDPNDPLSLNLYTYVKNNPLVYYDPTGHVVEGYYSGTSASPGWASTTVDGMVIYYNVYDKNREPVIVIDERTGENITEKYREIIDRAGIGEELMNWTFDTALPIIAGAMAGTITSFGNNISFNSTDTVNKAIFRKTTDEVMLNVLGQVTGGNPKAYAGYYAGKFVGDAAGITIGVGEIVLGTTGEVGGGLLTVTGIGSVIGVPIIVTSTGLILHGGGTIVTSGANAIADAKTAQYYFAMTRQGGSSGEKGDTEGGTDTVKGTSSTVTSNKGNVYDDTPSSNHSTTTGNPMKGEPNSSIDILDKNGNIKTRRWFGPDGNQIRDIDYTNHGNPKTHPEWPHEHGPRIK